MSHLPGPSGPPVVPPHHAPRASTPGSFGPAGVVLLVMALTCFFGSALPDALTHATFSDGEGQGDLGAMRFYVSEQVASAFVTLGVVLVMGAATCFAIAVVRRLRKPR